MTKDYSIKMQDSTGRIAIIGINGASIDEMVSTGISLSEAVQAIEDNSFEVAICMGEIGADAFLAPINA